MKKEKYEAKSPLQPLGDAQSDAGQPAEKHNQEPEADKHNPTEAQQRASDRSRLSGKGSGEGTTGMQRGDGHPKGR